MDEKTFIIKELMAENANLRVANSSLKYQLTQKEEELKHAHKEADTTEADATITDTLEA
jgi:regulator of replication initiation timing